MGLGFIVQRKKPFSSEALSQLSTLVVSGVMPFYVFYTTATNTTLQLLNKAPLLILVGALVPFITFIIAPLFVKLMKVQPAQKGAFTFCLMYGNTAFLGIPICSLLFGSEGAFYAVMYNFGITMIILSFGIWTLSGGGKNTLRNLLVNPLIWSMVAGILIAVSGIQLPEWVINPLSTVGNATLPIALLVAGAQIGNMPLEKNGYASSIIFVTVSRLVLVPAILIVIFFLLGWHDTEHQVMILQAAMPVGIASTILANRYQADGHFAAIATVWTTLLALLSLPLIAFLFFS